MAVTENDILELTRQLRQEMTDHADELRQELGVTIVEEVNKAAIGERMTAEVAATVTEAVAQIQPGLSGDEIDRRVRAAAEHAVAELPVPQPQIVNVESPCECSDAHGEALKTRMFVNELADRLGFPRMEL